MIFMMMVFTVRLPHCGGQPQSEGVEMPDGVAVVTGAAAGIGAASARALHKAGWPVVLLDRDELKVRDVAGSLGEGASALGCDVADEQSVSEAFSAIGEQHDRIGVLHSNAGIFLGHGVGRDGPLDELDPQTWRRTLDVNLTGTYLCVRSALPLMREAGGSIVFTASVSGALIGSTAPAYSASKAGLVGFMRSLVLTYAKEGIRVNSICPGPVMTDMSKEVRASAELRKRLVDNIPAGRIAEPKDIADLVVFLASPQGSYLNGAVLPMEGGLTIA
jgi:NAD(P)-dependent dehydrogenase (short-subunit alcohol dehydrogenase family)